MGAVIALAMVAISYLTIGGILMGQDAATQFYPWYGYLGERLGAGQIPEWNPAQFAGAPFAADPQSGWMYLPAMLFFTLLPRLVAIVAFLSFHLLLAGLATWVLARLVGIGRLGAVVAATAYMGSGVVLGRMPCCPASYELASWVPVCLAGVEVAVQSRHWQGRIAGWSVTGVALSQVLAVWLGQGAYYVLLLTGAYMTYRIVFDAPAGSLMVARWRDRLVLLGLHGAVVLVAAFGLAAAGILPRLEYNPVSNVAGGTYRGSGAIEAQVGGASAETVIGGIFQPSLYYAGVVTLALAVAAVVILGSRHATRFWLGMAIVTIVLAIPAGTPLHLVFSLLPRFEELHGHWPERVVLITYIAPAMLAGAMVTSLGHKRPAAQTALAAVLPLVCLAAFVVLGSTIPAVVPLLVGATSLVLLASVRGNRVVARKAFPLAILVLMVADIAITTRGLARVAPFGGYHRLEPSALYGANGAARFLQSRLALEEPFRFAGYDPALAFVEDGQPVLYRYQFALAEARSLLVNNRAITLGLEDIQGYNPIQIARYVEYITVLNGAAQEYHGADIYPPGLTSPLLDLLNVRYLVVPATVSPDRADLQALLSDWNVVYADRDVQVVRNPEALPRAWIVRDVRQSDGDALRLLAAGTIDPRRTALVEGSPPPVSSGGSADDRVEMLENDDPDELRLQVHADGPGFLVLSEIAYPAWRATINGEPVPLHVANGAFRGLPVPAGDHLVELRYVSPAMRWGLWVSGVTLVVMVAALGAAWWPLLRTAMLRRD